MASMKDILRFIRVEHSVFSLPFVYIGILLAPVDASWEVFALATLAAVGARGTAMALNRIVDRAVDAANPRTAVRELPSGRFGMATATGLTLAFLALYLSATHLLNPLVFKLSPLPLAAFIVYPYLKRWTSLCHLFLGFTLGFAPMGGWLAATGAWVDMAVPLLMAFGVMFWVAGFDIVYALLDVQHDRAHGIHSIPADMGVRSARTLAVVFHVATLGFFLAAGLVHGIGLRAMGDPLYWLALAVVAGLILYQHGSYSLDDPRSIGRAAFTVNGYAGFVLLAGVAAAAWADVGVLG